MTSTAELPPLPQVEPLLAGRYALGEALGVGGFALVYRAEDRQTRRPVAVKLYPPGAGEPDQARRRTEFELLTRLRHPNLVELLDAGEDDGRVFLVMPLVEGPSLERRLHAGPMPPGEVARLGAALADALAHVHRSGVVHRDVKPANVLLGERPLLTDSGIARLVGTAGMTGTGWLVGTPGYLAPEQVTGDEVGPATDVYALGLVLVEALTGVGPAQEGPASFDRPVRPPAVPPGLPGLTETLRAMTAPGPGRRPPAARVAEDLRRAAADLHGLPALPTPVVDPPPARAGSVPAALGDDRRRYVLAAALVVLALSGVAVGLRSAPALAPAPAPAPVVSAPDVAPRPAPPRPPAPLPGVGGTWSAGSGDEPGASEDRESDGSRDEAGDTGRSSDAEARDDSSGESDGSDGSDRSGGSGDDSRGSDGEDDGAGDGSGDDG